MKELNLKPDGLLEFYYFCFACVISLFLKVFVDLQKYEILRHFLFPMFRIVVEYLEQNNIEAYVKYNYFDKEQKQNGRAKPEFHVDNLYYNKEQDCYYCPMGQKMSFIGNAINQTETGYQRTISRYKAQNCFGCPIRGACHKRATERIIEVSHRLNELKTQARERLKSEQGLIHRSRRPIDVEPVFGMIKSNKGFKRFLLRGLEKVNIEFGLLALAHNLKKMATVRVYP